MSEPGAIASLCDGKPVHASPNLMQGCRGGEPFAAVGPSLAKRWRPIARARLIFMIYCLNVVATRRIVAESYGCLPGDGQIVAENYGYLLRGIITSSLDGLNNCGMSGN